MSKPTSLIVNEFFKSIQGESSFAGQVCTFVRLAGCNLACTYCDTLYARIEKGRALTIGSIAAAVARYKTTLVEITGGEPLMQEQVNILCRALLKKKYTVLVETNGSLLLSRVDARCCRIMDIKCPGSGMAQAFNLANLELLTKKDECKFVISDRADFRWAGAFIKKHALHRRCPVIVFSPNVKKLKPALLAEWIISSGMPVRLGLQLHKVIWPKNNRKR